MLYRLFLFFMMAMVPLEVKEKEEEKEEEQKEEEEEEKEQEQEQEEENIEPVDELLLILNSCTIEVGFVRSTSLDKNASQTVEFIRADNSSIRKNKDEELIDHVQLVDTDDVKDVALHLFYSLLHRHQHQLKKLEIYFQDYKRECAIFEIDNLENLEYLELYGYMKPHELVSKTRKPLKYLRIYDYSDDVELEQLKSCEQMFGVCESFKASKMQLTVAQFLRIPAPLIDIGFGTMHEILAIINAWKDDLIENEVKFYQWRLYDQYLDVPWLFRQLGATCDGTQQAIYRIEQNVPWGDSAYVSYTWFLPDDRCIALEPINDDRRQVFNIQLPESHHLN